MDAFYENTLCHQRFNAKTQHATSRHNNNNYSIEGQREKEREKEQRFNNFQQQQQSQIISQVNLTIKD